MKNKRYGSVAALLNLLAPGTGFLYAGYWRLALLTFFLLFSAIVFIGGSRFILSDKGLLSIFLLIVVTYLLTTLLAFFLARKANKHRTTALNSNKGQRWYSYIAFIVLSLVCAVSLFKHRIAFLGYSVYLLPSKSMASTLLPHDYIMVDTWIYQHEAPKKGDIAIFRYPPKPKILFIKRIIATEGDWVKIERGQVILNGRMQNEPYVLAENNTKTIGKEYQEWIVPKGQYFVLGDNRDGSNDSRYWGFVKQDAIQGKAMSIWFSYASKGGFKVRTKRISMLY
jgi:signal peptidase I